LTIEELTPRAAQYVAAKARWHSQVAANEKKMGRG
jgi:hypothetical protein